MAWVKHFYTQKTAWTDPFDPGGIFDHHRERAAAIERLSGAGKKRVLELGAGAGGSAAATADLGHSVVAVELSPLRAAHAYELARMPRLGSLAVLEADFYTVDLAGTFDVVCYWDGFGVGSDSDQRRLLHRVATTWLAPDGCMLMDVFSPWPWARAAGQERRLDQANLVNRSDFDPVGCRFLDRWWPADDQTQMITQSIRCYTPVDLLLLLEGTGLALELLEVDGKPCDIAADDATMRGALWEAWDYRVKLVPIHEGA